jgi:hypothetical protein
MLQEEHNRSAKIENLIWDIAKIIQPNSIVKKEKINEAKQSLLKIFNE